MSGHRGDELADLYALDALAPDEAARHEAHLERCAGCRWRVATALEVAAALAEVVEAPPPAELRARILAAATMPQVRPTAHSTGPPAERSGRRAVWEWTAVTAAAVVLVVATTFLLLSRRPTPIEAGLTQEDVEADPGAVTVALTSPAGAAGAAGEGVRVVWSAGERHAVLVGGELPALAPGQAYELWFIDDDQPVAGPLLPPVRVGVPFVVPAQAPDVLAVTIEPASGSVTPSGPVVLQGERPG